MKQKKFPNHILVKAEPGEDYFVILGTPDELAILDANEGERIATYTLNGPIKRYRNHARLEK